MIGKLFKLYAYSKAPRTTFSVLHPRTSAQLAHARYDMKHGWAPRASAVGAALIALPIGYLIGKATRRPRAEPHGLSSDL
jgi:hypothetical protein